MSKDRLYLESIRDCLERIAEYTEPGEGAFHASRLIQDGVIRNLEVIGEATKTNRSKEVDRESCVLWVVLCTQTYVHMHNVACVAPTKKKDLLLHTYKKRRLVPLRRPSSASS